MQILLLDNFDSFTYNLRDYVLQLGFSCETLRNDRSLEEILQTPFDALLISPGPCRPSDSGVLMPLLAHCIGRMPVLGVCLGHQAIGEHYGAKLIRAARPMHGKISHIQLQDPVLFEGLSEQTEVVRYNSLLLEALPEPLVCTAWTESGEIMALRHRTLPVFGVQFHPEAALTRDGFRMMQNWLTLVKTSH